jgi:glycosyltransferase involved in cell wall biosynthesis
MFTGLAARALSSVLLSLRLIVEHRRRRYDAVYQLSQSELFLLGRLRRLAPPIIVHPCTHAAGELRWHRLERGYALQSERRWIYLAVRAWLKLRSRLQPRELARAQLVVGLSERFNDLVHRDYGVPREKLRVLYTPVDLRRFQPLPPQGAPARDGRREILFISRISTRKGVEEVVQLSHRLSDLAGSVRLRVIGGATMWSDYRAHLRRLHPEVGEYVGSVPSDRLPALMQRATMLLVPSRYEPGSIATAEALACGLPVVLSDEVGNAEVAAGPHVRIHRAGEVDELEAAVRSLLAAMDEDASALRTAARANAERAFAVDRIVSELIDLVASLHSVPPAPIPDWVPAATSAAHDGGAPSRPPAAARG